MEVTFTTHICKRGEEVKLEEYKSGMYTRINDTRAFILTKIEYKWEWQDSTLSKLLAEASRLIGELNIYSLLTSETDTYMKIALKADAIKSCKIEGIDVNLQDLMYLKEEEKQNDIEEVNNYIQAMDYGIEKIKEGDKVSTKLITDIHKLILQGVRGKDKNPGRLRTSQECKEANFENNADFVPSAHTEIIECLTDFEKFINNDETEVPELVKIAILHYQFESIRPFSAGNGSTGRILVPLYLESKKILEKPCIYLSDYFEKNKDIYFAKLARVRTNSDMIGWIKFFLEAVIEASKSQKEKFIKLEELKKEVENAIEELSVKDGNGKKVFEVLYNEPIASRKKILEIGKMKPSTLNTIIKELLEKNMIEEITGQGRNQVFAFRKYIDVFENE